MRTKAVGLPAEKNQPTRMHSSRMRTVRSLSSSVREGSVSGGGGSLSGGLCLTGRSLSRESLSRGSLSRETPLWTDRHLSKHNLRKLRLRAVISDLLLSSQYTVNHNLIIERLKFCFFMAVLVVKKMKVKRKRHRKHQKPLNVKKNNIPEDTMINTRGPSV